MNETTNSPVKLRVGDRIKATNEHGESFEVTVIVLQPVALSRTNWRATVRRDDGIVFNCYTDCPDLWTLEVLTMAPESLREADQGDHHTQTPPKTQKALRTHEKGPFEGVFGLSWSEIERKQGMAPGTLKRP